MASNCFCWSFRGGGVAFLVPEAQPSKEPNVLTLYKKNSDGQLILGKNPFADAKGRQEQGVEIATIALRKDSWKYKKGDQGNSQLNLLGEFAQEVEESNKNSSEWKQLVKDMKPENQEEGQSSESSNPLDGLSGTATLYIDKIDCKNIGFNFSFLDEETQKVFKLTDDKIPAKIFPSQQGGLAYWSCHESLKTLE